MYIGKHEPKIRISEALAIAKADSVPVPGNRPITVEWTGHYPCLCHGEWVITVNGEKVDLPEDVIDSPMNTAGIYRTWHFGDNWSEEWEFYSDGLDFEDWVAQAGWLKDLDLSGPETLDLYTQISEQDWRHNSCGGCI
jgi:hypothetical protein